MTFISFPLAVAGACAVAVPILIFLLWRQRRKPIEWGAMRFLIEAYRKHRRRLQVEQLLLLAVRCLIPLLLGLALARPILERAGLLDGGSSRVVYLMIDDGLAAGVEDAEGENTLARHIEEAKSIIGSLEGGDRVGLITLARPAQARLSPPSTDLDAVTRLVGNLQPKAVPTDVAGGLDSLRRALADQEDEQNQTFVYLLSDFRRGSASLEDPLPASLRDLGDRVVLRTAPPASTPIANVQISAVQPARHIVLGDGFDGAGQITVRLTRQGGELARDVSRVTLTADEVTAPAPQVITWEPGQSEASCEFRLDLVESRNRDIGVRVKIDDDRLGADNERSTVLAYRKALRVTMLDRRAFGFEPSLERLSAGAWFARALAPTEFTPIELVTVEPAALDPADLRTTDVVVLPRPDLLTDAGWPLLARFVDRGGLLLITPPAGRTVHRWPDALGRNFDLPWSIEREVRESDDGQGLALDQPASVLLRMIASDLGALCRPIVVNRWLPVTTRGEVVLVFDEGEPFMVLGSPDNDAGTETRGLVAYLAAAPELEWTNLPSKPLMVPLVHETIRQGLSQIRGSDRLAVGADAPLLLGPAAASLLDDEGTRTALLEGSRPETPLTRPGLYTVLDPAQQPIGRLAVNVEPEAGRTDPQAASAVSAWLGVSGPWAAFDPADVTGDLVRADAGSPLAKWLLIAVLFLVLLETFLARWFSHASRGAGVDGDRSRGLRATLYERSIGSRPPRGDAAGFGGTG